MATATLKARIGLDSRGFQKGLRGVKKFSRRFKSQVGAPILGATKNLAKMGITAGTLAVAGFTALTFASAKMLDQFDKMSQRTGMSTEFLSKFGLGLELAGGSMQDLEKLATRLQKSIVEAGQGLSTPKRAFKELGLSFEDLAKKSPEEQFEAVLEALKAVPNQAKKSALAQQLLGKAGTKLLPLINNLEEIKGLSEKLGLNISKEEAKAGADFNDAILKLKKSFEGLFLKTIGFEKINKVINGVTEAVIKLRNSAEFQTFIAKFSQFSTTVANGAIAIARGFMAMVNTNGAQMKKLAKTLTAFSVLFFGGFIKPILTGLSMLVMGFLRSIKGAILPLLVAFGSVLTGLALGDALEKSFDLSGILAKLGLQIKTLWNFMKAIGDKKQMRKVIEDYELGLKLLEDSSTKNGKGFGENLQESFKKGIDSAKKGLKDAGKDLLESTGLDAIGGLIEETKKAGKFDFFKDDPKGLEKIKNDVGGVDNELNKIVSKTQKFRGGFAKMFDGIAGRMNGNRGGVEALKNQKQKILERRGVGVRRQAQKVKLKQLQDKFKETKDKTLLKDIKKFMELTSKSSAKTAENTGKTPATLVATAI